MNADESSSREDNDWTNPFKHRRGEYGERSAKGTTEYRVNGKSRRRVHSCRTLEPGDGVWWQDSQIRVGQVALEMM